jgi:hypothetical protein
MKEQKSRIHVRAKVFRQRHLDEVLFASNVKVYC